MDAYTLEYNYWLYCQKVKPLFIEAYRNTYGTSQIEAIEASEKASPAYMKEVIDAYREKEAKWH